MKSFRILHLFGPDARVFIKCFLVYSLFLSFISVNRFLFLLQTPKKINRSSLLRRTLSSKTKGKTAQLKNLSPHLTSTSLPQRLWYHWQLSAWYLLLLKHLTILTFMGISLSLSVSLTHVLAACWYHFFLPDYACKHTHTHANLVSPTLTFSETQFDKKRRAAETGGVLFFLLSDLSVLVREPWFVHDLWLTVMSEDPPSNTPVVLV